MILRLFLKRNLTPKTKEIKSEIFILYPEQSEFIKLPELKINPINVRNFLNNKLKILIFSKIGKEEIVFDFSKISYQSNYEQVYLNEKDFNDY